MNRYRCETCKKYKWDGCIALAKDTSLIQVVGCASHSDFQSEREKVPIHSFEVKKPGFPCITRRELAYNDISKDEDDFTRLHIPVEVGDEIRIYRQKAGEP